MGIMEFMMQLCLAADVHCVNSNLWFL